MDYVKLSREPQGSRFYGIGGMKFIEEDWSKASANTIDKTKAIKKEVESN